jgi:hypothetical protein
MNNSTDKNQRSNTQLWKSNKLKQFIVNPKKLKNKRGIILSFNVNTDMLFKMIVGILNLKVSVCEDFQNQSN